ncbi:hypothetical protein ASG51_16425 [Methylobacterium sp. Leaf465]|uniref:hypothetical protein n=1 Tax=Methylobacterium sp. Leaf465 TaxID=1736385 RepID=UPI0006F6FDE0|nr:hypothetical protein [Methylobacterium sp. Leaf465]KQT83722.1 hypothetical protein ASG51_16425 [Methylobacterium sp. Leaf465]
MLRPAEFEDMRLDFLAAEQARLYDVAFASLNRYWTSRGATSVGSVTRICELVYERAAERHPSDWKAIVSEATAEAGFQVRWHGDEVVSLEAKP